MSIWSLIYKGLPVLMSKTKRRSAFAMVRAQSLVWELDRDLYAAKYKVERLETVSTKDLREYNGSVIVYEIMEFILFRFQQRMDRTPDNKVIDPDFKLFEASSNLERTTVALLKCIHPDKEIYTKAFDFIDRLQKLRDEMVERDCMLSPVVGDPIRNRTDLVRALRDD